MSGAESRGGGEEGFGVSFLTLSQRGGSQKSILLVMLCCVCACVCVRVWCGPSLSVCAVLAEAG